MTDLASRAPVRFVEPRPTPRKALGIELIVLGIGVAASALLGPVAFGVIDYHASAGAVDQVTGGDFAALFLVAPAALLAGILTLRGHLAGPVIGIGPAVFAVYTYTQLTLGGDFRRYPGNSEDYFLLNLALFVIGGLAAIGAWSAIDPARLPKTTTRIDRALASLLIVAGLFLVVGLHLPQLMALWRGIPTEEYLADPGPFWVVKLMDLGIIAPALLGVAAGLLAGRPWADKAKYVVVAWFALLGASVAGMAVMMQMTGAAGASLGNVVAFGLFALVAITLAFAMFRPLFGERRAHIAR